jgi:hypothetical protein
MDPDPVQSFEKAKCCKAQSKDMALINGFQGIFVQRKIAVAPDCPVPLTQACQWHGVESRHCKQS